MKARLIASAMVTPLGRDPQKVLARCEAEQSAAKPNSRFDASTYPCTVAAAIDEPAPKTPHDRILRRMGRFGFDVATRALATLPTLERGPRLGLWVGVGGLRAHWDEMMPALAKQDPDFGDSWARGLRQIHPFWMLRHLSNNTHALLAQEIEARGEGVTFGGSNADGQAIAAACDALAAGTVDAAIVLAYDSLIDPESIASRDATFVPGEAAAVMILKPADAEQSGPLVCATTGADGRDGLPSDAVRNAMINRLSTTSPSIPQAEDHARFFGDLGAASAMVSTLCEIERLRRDGTPKSSAICLSVGAPGLAAAVRIDV